MRLGECLGFVAAVGDGCWQYGGENDDGERKKKGSEKELRWQQWWRW